MAAPTVQEILKATGLTDEQIAALDPKVIPAFTQVVSTASQEREAAELAKRATHEYFANDISPALDKWANEKAALDAQIAFYKAQNEAARSGGFIPTDAPNASPTPNPTAGRDPSGKFVAGAGPVPGSPQFMTVEQGWGALNNSQWALVEYMRLHNGAPLPDDLQTLANEAQAQRMDFKTYVAKKYDFETKREQIKTAEQKKRDDALVADAVAANDKKWAEKVGNNPMVRTATDSRFANIEKAVKEGQRPDPLKMTREQRHSSTQREINKDIASNSVQ